MSFVSNDMSCTVCYQHTSKRATEERPKGETLVLGAGAGQSSVSLDVQS